MGKFDHFQLDSLFSKLRWIVKKNLIVKDRGSPQTWSTNGQSQAGRRPGWRAALWVSLAAVSAGVLVYSSRLAEPIERLSFDTIYLLRPQIRPDEVVVLKMGDSTYRHFNQRYPAFDRALHANLVRRLADDGAKLVVFDFLFDGATDSDPDFAAAIKEHGTVVIGVSSEPFDHPRLAGFSMIEAASSLTGIPGCRTGLLGLPLEPDLAVRRFRPESTAVSSLSLVAARAVGVEIVPEARPRWVAYYGEGALNGYDYEFALDKEPGYFRGKVVFVGGKPDPDYPGAQADVFATSATRWSGRLMSGVEIQATMFLNLIRGEWLIRLGFGTELLMIIGAGVGLGIAFSRLRPLMGVLVLAGVAVTILLLGAALGVMSQRWFNWFLLAGIQAPVAWIAAGILYTRALERERRTFMDEMTRERPTETVPLPSPNADAGKTARDDAPCDCRVIIRDFTLLKCVGTGGYGEVWLARSVTGAFKAIKVVFRRKFDDERPFLREFEGVENFEPISRSHPGWVAILHVARDVAAGHFYYVMDPADDLRTGRKIDPELYQPKTLENLLIERHTLTVNDCIGLGVSVAEALGALHERDLIHRDIKPSNIIYIDGQPRIADIGLVAQQGKSRSYVGTEGFIPPEGPGKPLSDIYSLGRVLYQAAAGTKSDRHREFMAALDREGRDRDLALYLEVAAKACAPFHGHRFQSARELGEALTLLEMRLRSTLRENASKPVSYTPGSPPVF